jgi:preprotein translocase subunit SecE
MGRLKRKKPILSRGRRTDDRQKSANGSESLKKKSATENNDLSESSNNSKKFATVSKKTSPNAGEPISVVKYPVFWVKTRQFLQEVKMELKRVTWPSRKETIGSTVVVIILVLIISFFLGIVDFGLSNLVGAVLR